MKRRPSNLKKSVGVVLSMLVMLSYFSPMQQTLRTLPDHLDLTQGQARTIALGGMTLTPREGSASVSASEDETLRDVGAVDLASETVGTSELLLSLMGIPLRKVEVQVSPEKRLIPGGQAIGVAMRTEGVLVVGVADLQDAASPAQLCGIQPGDVIRRVGGANVTSAEQLSALVAASEGKPLNIEFLRDGAALTTTMIP